MTTCVVIGSAACVFNDLRIVKAQCPELLQHVIAVKAIGAYWRGPLRAWVSLHPSQFPEHQAIRHARGYEPCSLLYAPRSLREYPGVISSIPDRGGTSGMYAVDVALATLGYDRVVLAGVPMDSTPYFNHNGSIVSLERYRDAWRRNQRRLAPVVRSLSGWTKDLFGAPTRPWMEG